MSVYTDVDVATLPVAITTTGSKILGGLAVFFGGSFTLIPLAAVVQSASERADPDWQTAAILFGAMGLLFGALLLWGIDQLVRRQVVTIDTAEVRWERRRLFGTRRTSALLASFDGVLYSSPWTKQSSVTHLLELKHPDPNLTVRLYWANRDDELYARWQSYCRAFSVRPVERLAPGWPLSRPVEDIGRPMMALVREGKIRIPEPAITAPAGISIDRTDAGLAAEVEGCRVTVQQDGLSIRLHVGDTERHYPYDRVESMVVKPATYRSRAALSIGVIDITRDEREGDQESRREIPVGEGLSVTTLEWAQARLLKEIAFQSH